ncbi:hypothetical protein KC354_g2499 [Hortaea werneckii]|nr:hypothetical protein KC354_g2499 [Hortaea werneckii]
MPERLFQEVLKEDLDETNMQCIEDRKGRIRKEQRNPNIDAATNADALKEATSKLHFWAIENYLFVADKVALDTGKALLVFFNDCGRTVRQSRIRPEYGEPFAGS